MPIYMDVHIIPGIKARDIAEAHRKDLFHQDEFECKCMTYWVDERRENVFCLIEAASRESVEEMHSRAHGMIPNKIIEVDSLLVESFLGRIYDPEEAEISGGLKILQDSSFRILLVTRMTDPVLLQRKFGREKTLELLNHHNNIIRRNISQHEGSEVEQGGTGFVISFVSAARAVSCALAIQKEIPEACADDIGFRMGINAGDPVEKSNKLFGDTINLAKYMCAIAGNAQVAIASSVIELVSKDYLGNEKNKLLAFSPQDETLLELLFSKLDENWQNPDFSVDEYCRAMAMSKSQLYRKTIALTGLSPNILLKEFRLEKAKELMKKQRYTVSQITFDSGFTSPSYFTKCFKKKYGLLPMSYLDLLY
ncbi:MAG TPA: nickel-binding protein [Chitinophagaceae bacterium]|nr:nickel-binding protein [Chitinophagaceae bacterium]